LFIRRKGENVSIIAVYVDDCLHVYKGEGMKRDLYAALRDANLQGLKIEELKPESPISFLGLNIMRSKENMDLKVNQSGYLANILDEYEEDFVNLRCQPNPSDENVFRPVYSGEDLEPVPVSKYLSKLMKIRYLVRTRPDIELTCAALCTRSRNPTKGDEKYLNKLLKYLSDNNLLGIIIKMTDLQLVAWFDSGFAIHLDRKSHSGHLVCFGDTGIRVPIHWRSTKQKVVATSSTEAELIAMYEGLDFIIWFKRVLEFLGVPQKTIRVFQDNTSTITMVFFGRGSSGSMTRHIDIKYFFTKQFIEDLTFVIEHLPRENMMADFFASPRTGQGFRRMRDILMRGV
jgi:histone deacetylase 1/2